MKNSDKEWEKWGARDPYFAVLTHDKYRIGMIDGPAKAEFFETGEKDVARVMEIIRDRIEPDFKMKRALDFGCGVGRIVLPLSQVADTVVGIDVSPSMLNEAQKNALAAGVRNVEFVQGDDDLTGVTSKFNFIHSKIVFQHIPVRKGMRVFRRLLNVLEDGGVCALHFTYGSRFQMSAGMLNVCKRAFSGFFTALFGSSDPEMQMNSYNLNLIFLELQNAGIRNAHVELTDHGGELGIFLVFKFSAK